MDFGHAFHLLRELGQTADGAMLPLPALTAIHWTHRAVAVAVAGYLIFLGVRLIRAGLRREGQSLHALVALQFMLGLSNVWFGLPLAVAVAHNAGAALLAMLLVVINFRVAKPPSAVTSALHPKSLFESPR
jgi:cytochrome c oxidase assembly protein subunit 15